MKPQQKLTPDSCSAPFTGTRRVCERTLPSAFGGTAAIFVSKVVTGRMFPMLFPLKTFHSLIPKVSLCELLYSSSWLPRPAQKLIRPPDTGQMTGEAMQSDAACDAVRRGFSSLCGWLDFRPHGQFLDIKEAGLL